MVIPRQVVRHLGRSDGFMVTKICGLAQDICHGLSISSCLLLSCSFSFFVAERKAGQFSRERAGHLVLVFWGESSQKDQIEWRDSSLRKHTEPIETEIRTLSRTKSQAGWTRVMVNTTTLHINIRCHPQQSAVTSLVLLTPPHEGS